MPSVLIERVDGRRVRVAIPPGGKIPLLPGDCFVLASARTDDPPALLPPSEARPGYKVYDAAGNTLCAHVTIDVDPLTRGGPGIVYNLTAEDGSKLAFYSTPEDALQAASLILHHLGQFEH